MAGHCTSNIEAFFEKGPSNVLRFLDKCKKGNYYSSVNLNEKFINEKLEEIISKKYILDDIKIQRDKIIAHEDLNNFGLVNNVTLDEIGSLLDFCKDIIFHIYVEIYDSHFDFEIRNSPMVNLKKILDSLDQNELVTKEKRENKIRELIRGNNFIK